MVSATLSGSGPAPEEGGGSGGEPVDESDEDSGEDTWPRGEA